MKHSVLEAMEGKPGVSISVCVWHPPIYTCYVIITYRHYGPLLTI